MHEATILEYTANAMLLVLYLSLPPIIAAATVGTLVSLFQALTQIQEQTLSFSIKLVVVMTIMLTGRWIGGELLQYATHIFDSIPVLVK